MTFDKHSFSGATIELSAPTLKLRTGGPRVAWKEAKYIVPRPCRARQSGRLPRPCMRTFRVTGSFQGLPGQFVILEMSILELSKYIKNNMYQVTNPRIRISAAEMSVPASNARWMRMNSAHVVLRLRSGAGGIP
jgi:hypothetical protein